MSDSTFKRQFHYSLLQGSKSYMAWFAVVTMDLKVVCPGMFLFGLKLGSLVLSKVIHYLMSAGQKLLRPQIVLRH